MVATTFAGNAPLVSVVMSVYNGEKYVGKAVRSILDQTLAALEFIIIDDGSTDDSRAILEKIALDDRRVRLIHRENRGLARSLNEGISIARGRWIARMDADDIALPERLERQLKRLEKTGADVCGGSVKIIGTGVPRVWRYFQSDAGIKTQLLFNSAFAHPTVMLKTTLARQHQYDETLSCAQDYDLWTRLAGAGASMTNCPSVLLEYRVHGGQVTSQKRDAQFEVRNNSAKRYWASMGMEFPFSSLERFRDLEEASRVCRALTNISWTRDQQTIVAHNVWKIALRSCDLGTDLWREIRRAQALHPGFLRSASLLLLCAPRLSPKGKLFQLMYKLR